MDGVPYMFWEVSWSPICGHWFWDNQHGAEAFCQKLGFNGGRFNKVDGAYDEDAIEVGKCNSEERIDSCTAGNNFYTRTDWCKAGERMKITIACDRHTPGTEPEYEYFHEYFEIKISNSKN